MTTKKTVSVGSNKQLHDKDSEAIQTWLRGGKVHRKKLMRSVSKFLYSFARLEAYVEILNRSNRESKEMLDLVEEFMEDITIESLKGADLTKTVDIPSAEEGEDPTQEEIPRLVMDEFTAWMKVREAEDARIKAEAEAKLKEAQEQAAALEAEAATTHEQTTEPAAEQEQVG